MKYTDETVKLCNLLTMQIMQSIGPCDSEVNVAKDDSDNSFVLDELMEEPANLLPGNSQSIQKKLSEVALAGSGAPD